MKYVLEPGLENQRVILSVTEITRNIKALLESGFTDVWVEGELSNFKFHSSGHMYFSLKDDEAQVSCVMFRRENIALPFEMKDGLKVACFGRISVYAPRGQYQLYVERVEPKGLGALQLKFQQLKEKLFKEGLFEASRKRSIPFLPKKIGIVTSIDGAALRDILNVLGRRFSSAHILIYPVPVQGASAAPSISEAIEVLNRENAADVLILARGGGSLEDLWAFNEEIVARSIFESKIPVISAIGHETDFTIADFVSDLRAPTPSAAAEMVLPRREDLLVRIAELRARSSQAVLGEIENLKQVVRDLSECRVLKDPLFPFEARFQKLDELLRRMHVTITSFIFNKKQAAAHELAKLDALGPLATLRRGFSVSLKLPEKSLISSVKLLRLGDQIETRLKDGFFVSRVTDIK